MKAIMTIKDLNTLDQLEQFLAGGQAVAFLVTDSKNWAADPVVGRHSKGSFLYSYVMAHLIDVKTENLAGNYSVELKGTHRKVTERGIDALAKKLTARIKRLSDSASKDAP